MICLPYKDVLQTPNLKGMYLFYSIWLSFSCSVVRDSLVLMILLPQHPESRGWSQVLLSPTEGYLITLPPSPQWAGNSGLLHRTTHQIHDAITYQWLVQYHYLRSKQKQQCTVDFAKHVMMNNCPCSVFFLAFFLSIFTLQPSLVRSVRGGCNSFLARDIEAEDRNLK